MTEEKAFLVCFFGVDGAGKTTTIGRLSKSLISAGTRSTVQWLRYEPNIASVLSSTYHRLYGALTDNPASDQRRRQFLSRKGVKQLYRAVSLVDYLITTRRRLILPSHSNEYALFDRYIEDFISEMVAESSLTIRGANRLRKILESFLPVPDLYVYMDVPLEVAMMRKNDISSPDYVLRRKNAYRVLVPSLVHLGRRVVEIDGTWPLEEIEKSILKQIHARRTDG